MTDDEKAMEEAKRVMARMVTTPPRSKKTTNRDQSSAINATGRSSAEVLKK